MKYRSTHATLDVCFEFGGKTYVVPPGSECEVPDCWHPWVVSRGLLLELVAETPAPDPEVAEPEPAAEQAPFLIKVQPRFPRK